MEQPSILSLLFSWFFFIITLVLITPIILVASLHKAVVTLFLRKIFYPELKQLMTGLDVAFSMDDFWVAPGGAIGFTHFLDGPIDPVQIKNKLFQVLTSVNPDDNYERLTSLYPKLWMGYSFWCKIRSDSFKIENHIRVLFDDWSSHNVKISQSNMDEIIKEWLRSPFRFESPVWDVLIIPKYINENEEVKSLFAFRIHHIIGDGYSCLLFLEKLFDDNEMRCRLEKLVPDPPDTSEEKLKLLLWMPYIIFHLLLRKFVFYNDWFTKRKSCREVEMTTTFLPLEELKQVRKQAGSNVSLNTIVLHKFGSALRRSFIQQFGEANLPYQMNVFYSLPIPEQPHPIGTFCNHWSYIAFRLPLREPEPTKRLKILSSELDLILGMKMQKVFLTFFNTFLLLPTCILRPYVYDRVSPTILMSNLQGPTKPGYFCRRRIERRFGITNELNENTHVMICTMSYNGEVTLNLLANQHIMPTQKVAEEALNLFFQEELHM